MAKAVASFREGMEEGEALSARATANIKKRLEKPLMKVVGLACHERELRGDLEVLLEESLALLVRCMKVRGSAHLRTAEV